MKITINQLKQIIKEEVLRTVTEAGMSPQMHRKADPDKNVKRVLKKWGYSDYLSDVNEWTVRETVGPKGLKKQFISMMSGVDFYEIDLQDTSTWGSTEDVPSDEFFVELSKAIAADTKAASRRSSYEF